MARQTPDRRAVGDALWRWRHVPSRGQRGIAVVRGGDVSFRAQRGIAIVPTKGSSIRNDSDSSTPLPSAALLGRTGFSILAPLVDHRPARPLAPERGRAATSFALRPARDVGLHVRVVHSLLLGSTTAMRTVRFLIRTVPVGTSFSHNASTRESAVDGAHGMPLALGQR